MLPALDAYLASIRPAAHAAEIGAATGISNARGLAGMYARWLMRQPERSRPVSKDTLARMAAVSSASGLDAPYCSLSFTLGYINLFDNRHVPGCTENDSVIISEEAFGHSGFGGAMGLRNLPRGCFRIRDEQNGPRDWDSTAEARA